MTPHPLDYAATTASSRPRYQAGVPVVARVGLGPDSSGPLRRCARQIRAIERAYELEDVVPIAAATEAEDEAEVAAL